MAAEGTTGDSLDGDRASVGSTVSHIGAGPRPIDRTRRLHQAVRPPACPE
jgi:hypothetical protein